MRARGGVEDDAMAAVLATELHQPRYSIECGSEYLQRKTVGAPPRCGIMAMGYVPFTFPESWHAEGARGHRSAVRGDRSARRMPHPARRARRERPSRGH